MTTSERFLAFREFRLDPENACLWRGLDAVKLKPKAFDVLRYLAERPGRLVSKDDLWRSLWPDVAVTDGVLAVCLTEIRQALGDNAKAPRFIETVHRRGYRFIAEVADSRHSVVSWEEEKQRAKGKGQRAKTFGLPFLPPTLQHLAPTLVGRDAELTHLHGWLDKALNGERQIVFVTGEPGIGKTALVDAFLQGLVSKVQGPEGRQKAEGKRQKAKLPKPRPSPPVPWISWGQCIEHYGAGEAYLPVLQSLEELGQGEEAERDFLLAVLRQYAPSWLRQLPALVSPTERETLQQQTAGVTRERMLRELVTALEALTTHQSLVLVLEDLHWSDPSTVDFLALLARRQGPARLLVIGTYRPVDVIVSGHPIKGMKQELQMHGQCQELPLRLLSEAAVVDYLAMRLPLEATHAQAALPQLARTMHQRTEGNPLFMVTVTNYVLTQEVKSTGGEVASGDFVRLLDTVPVELQQMITRQVEALTPEDQHLLDTASVVGAEFSAAAVAAGVGEDVVTVEGQCEQIARRGHVLQARGTAVWPDGTAAGRYGFLHALYQEVLYERLPAARRRQLHQRAGEGIETAYGKWANEIASELAVHFERGGNYWRAVHYRQQAGENAVRRSAYVEATAHLTKGLELLQTLPDTSERARQELTLHSTLGTALIAIEGYAAPEVEKTYNRALLLCRQAGDTPQLFPVLWGLWAFYHIRGELQTASEMAEQFLSLAQRGQNPVLLLEAHYMLGETLYFLGELIPARVHLEQEVVLSSPQKHHHGHDPVVGCLFTAALDLWALGYPDQALKRGHEALTLARELSHPFSLALALHFATSLHVLRREEQAGRERAEELIALSTEQGFSFRGAIGMMFRGWALSKQGQGEAGIAQIRQGLAAWRATGARLGLPSILALLAVAYARVGWVEEGLTSLEEALAVVDKTGERVDEAALYVIKGWLLLARAGENHAETEACFLKAIEVARQQQAKSMELRAVTSLARLWKSQGKQAEAHQLLSLIYGWFTEGFDTKDLQEATALLKELT